MTLTRLIHHKALRRRTAVKFLWFYLVTSLDLTGPQMVKVRPTAAALGLRVRTLRRALRALVQARYLVVVTAPTRGTPGVYQAGPRAYRVAAPQLSPSRRGPHGPPSPVPQLALDLPPREGLDYAA